MEFDTDVFAELIGVPSDGEEEEEEMEVPAQPSPPSPRLQLTSVATPPLSPPRHAPDAARERERMSATQPRHVAPTQPANKRPSPVQHKAQPPRHRGRGGTKAAPPRPPQLALHSTAPSSAAAAASRLPPDTPARVVGTAGGAANTGTANVHEHIPAAYR